MLDDDRGWLIPLEDLLAARFCLNAPAPPDASLLQEKKGVDDPAAGTRRDTAPDEMTSATRAELERLRHEHALALADERNADQLGQAEARYLQARLEERGARTQDLQRALAAV